MSSKIPHPMVGLPIARALGRAADKGSGAAGAKKNGDAKAPARGAPRGAGARPTVAQHDGFGEGETLGGDAHEHAHGERNPNEAPHKGPASLGAQGALTPPQKRAAPSAGKAQELKGATQATAATDAHKADRARWARIFAQASPERLAQGAAVLERHQAALTALTKLVPGLPRPR